MSGCWLKFDWVNNIISFYGLNRPVALDFIERARKQLANKKAQEKIQEEQQAQEKAVCDRAWLLFVAKEYGNTSTSEPSLNSSTQTHRGR